MTFKTKKQLDLLTEKQIENYRFRMLTSSNNFTKGSDDAIYVDEREVYMDERFDRVNKRFDNWQQRVRGGDTDAGIKLIVSIGREGVLYFHNEKLKEPKKYIQI